MGGCCAAAIGMGCNYNNSDLYAASIGEITITNSDVTATGGRWAAAIGFPYSEQHLGAATYRAGKITITTADEATFVSKLKSGEAMPLGAPPQRIGKGAYAATTPTFLNTDGTGPWEAWSSTARPMRTDMNKITLDYNIRRTNRRTNNPLPLAMLREAFSFSG